MGRRFYENDEQYDAKVQKDLDDAAERARLSSQIRKLLMAKPENSEQWTEICILEARLVELGGEFRG